METNEKIISLKYRNWLHGQPPKRIKLQIGDWAGTNTWTVPQPWHCKPYADANTYGLELIYTWQTPCTVTCDEKGICNFEGDFTAEKPDYLEKDWHPFACFAPFHFGYVAMVDIKTPNEHNLMVLPHPRAFSCKDGSTPVAVPGMLEMDWWPEIFFIVFKAPLPGCKYVFKHGDPIAQFMVMPRDIKYDIEPMSDEEEALRAKRQDSLEKNWHRLCTRVYYSEDENEFFDNKYKVLSGIVRRDGQEEAEKFIDNPKLIPHYNQNPQVVDHRLPEKQNNYHHAPWPEKELEELKKESNDNLSELNDPDIIKQLDEIIEKDTEDISDDELERLIVTFKMQKRKERKERSQKLKKDSDKNKVVFVNPSAVKQQQKSPPKEEYILGHKIEKLIKK